MTPENRDLLHGIPVRFVGMATVGQDHLDTGWLEGPSPSGAGLHCAAKSVTVRAFPGPA
jgi:hypothetical protein